LIGFGPNYDDILHIRKPFDKDAYNCKIELNRQGKLADNSGHAVVALVLSFLKHSLLSAKNKSFS
jgi:hypothetical protein